MSFLTSGNVLPSPHLWGIIMLVASILLVAGMATKKKEAVQYASMIDFVLWSFAMLTYSLAGIWLIPISFALVNLLGFGYIYLASSLNVLWSH
jgi:hypothetical protein